MGCSALIAAGQAKVKSDSGIKAFAETGLLFEDGTTVEADLVVFCTGCARLVCYKSSSQR